MQQTDWARTARKWLLPALTGSWGHRGGLVYRRPVEWILSYVVAQSHSGSNTFHLIAGSQLLAQPASGLVLNVSLYGQRAALPHLSSKKLDTFRDLPTSPDQSETVMLQCADAIITEGIPYLDEYGTLEGQAIANEGFVASNPRYSNAHECLCYIRLLQGDIPGCLAAADAAQHTARSDGRGWALEIADRVDQIADLASRNPERAIDVLRENVDRTCSRLRLPTR